MSCAGVAPAITAAAIEFGQDLLASAAQNHTPQYASQLEKLLLAMVREQTGWDLQPRLQQQYAQRPPYGQAYPQGQYGQQQNPYQQPYPQDPYAQPQDPYAQQYPQDPYAQPQDPYAQQYPQDPYAQPQDPYAQPQDPYAQPQDPYAQPQDPYAQQYPQDQYVQASPAQGYPGGVPRTRGLRPGSSQEAAFKQPQQESKTSPGLVPVAMDVALLAQRKAADGTVTLEAIQDGAVLHDGRGDPKAGDKIKISFKANCDCYVYVIGVDATGWVAQIFPDPDSALKNPVQRDREYLLPEGNLWWGLDDYRGTETIYFLASKTRRSDIEDAVATLAKNKRTVPPDFRPVQTAAVVPATRGLVKVEDAAPLSVQSQTGETFDVTPTAFLSTASDSDLVITRWFKHQ